MTANHAHTRDTEQVRDGYSRKPPGHAVLKSRERQAAEFDRWYAAEIAAAEQRGAVKALRELAKDAVLVPASPDKAAKFYRDRADRLEGDDETH